MDLPSQHPVLHPIETLRKDLKQAAHARKPTNILEWKRFNKEEWTKFFQADTGVNHSY